MRSWRAPAARDGERMVSWRVVGNGGGLSRCLPWLIVVWLLLMKDRAGSELKR